MKGSLVTVVGWIQTWRRFLAKRASLARPDLADQVPGDSRRVDIVPEAQLPRLHPGTIAEPLLS